MNFRFQHCLIAILLLCTVSRLHAVDPNLFKIYNFDLHADGSSEMVGRLYVPDEADPESSSYAPETSWPIIVFFHGSGEAGSRSTPPNDNQAQVKNNIENLFAHARDTMLLLAMQSPNNWGTANVKIVLQMLANAMDDYNIDPTRIYVIGLSMGGGGTWEAMTLHPEIFAAGVPASAVSPSTNLPERLVDIPIFAFHAIQDSSVSSSTSRTMVNQILAVREIPAVSFPPNAPGSPLVQTYVEEDPIRYMEWAFNSHTIWEYTYKDSANILWPWLNSKTRDMPELGSGHVILLDFGNKATSFTSTDAAGRTWNSTEGGYYDTMRNVIPFAYREDAVSTGVQIDVVEPFGKQHMTLSLDLPQNSSISGDGWTTRDNATSDSNRGTLRIRGLKAGQFYRIEIFATISSEDSPYGRTSRYQIGNAVVDLDAYRNSSDTAVFDFIKADKNGTIDLSVYGSPLTGARYGLINTMEIKPLLDMDGDNLPDTWETDQYGSTAHGMIDDPDGNGITALAEFALFLAPGHAGKSLCPVLETSGGILSLKFPRRISNVLTYGLESSQDLKNWSPETALPATAPTTTVPIEGPNGSTVFHRLRVGISEQDDIPPN